MIYVIQKYCSSLESYRVDSVWDVDAHSVEKLYSSFLAAKAKEIGIIINPHRYNIMNREDHHPELTVKEYRVKDKVWDKYLKQHSIEWYIEEVLKGKKLKYKNWIYD